jgi:steroid 5-alpha reductase family enzyme
MASSVVPYENSIKRFLTLVVPCFAVSQGLAYAASAGDYKQLGRLAAFAILLQWVVFFLHASGLVFGNERTERYYDLTGSLTFLLTSAWSSTFVPSAARSERQKIVTTLLQVWALRLGSFLFSRIASHGGVDSRFTAIKPSLLRFFGAWTLQGVWVFITALPVLSLNQAVDKKPLDVVDYVGVLLWGTGFLFEVTADLQKTFFLQGSNKKFIDTGLWSLSRHPNYFGEILLWIGVAMISSNGMKAWSSQAISSWVSPLFVALLLIFISGIPMLEKASDAKWGNQKNYKLYKEITPVLIPIVGRKGSAPF